MSWEAIEGFFAKVSQDQTLQKAVQEAYADGVNAEAHATVVDLAAGQGFEFSVDKLDQAWAAQEGELSDDQLENVAGGFGGMCCCCGGGSDDGTSFSDKISRQTVGRRRWPV